MQKPFIPPLNLPQKEYLEEIIHLDLPYDSWHKLSKYGDWCYGWPERYEGNDGKVQKKMLAMIESRQKNQQDLHLPITTILPSDSFYNPSVTLMHEAVKNDKYISVTRKLLEVGVNPNRICYKHRLCERRPLQVALIKGAFQTVELLLTLPGIDVHIQDSEDKTSLLYYARLGFKSDENLLFKVMKMLLDGGVDPNSTDIKGRTELFRLAFEEQQVRPLIMLMCWYGLKIDIKDKEGKTAVEQVEYWRKINREVARERGKSTLDMCRATDIIQSECPRMIFAVSLKQDSKLYFNLLPMDILMQVADKVIANNH